MSYLFSVIKSLRYIDFSFLRRKPVLNIIRNNWGKEASKDREFSLISIYHNLIKEDDPNKFVDENTWTDLNMDSVFSSIDRNVSAVGSQYLYSLMHRYENDSSNLLNRFAQYDYFMNNKDIREKILVQLYKLRHNNASYIPKLIFQDVPERPKLFFIFYLLSFIMLVSMALIYFNPVFVFVSILIAVINLFINMLYGRNIAGYFVDISYLSALLRVGIKLSEFNEDIIQIKDLKDHQKLSVSLNKRIAWLVIDKSRLDEITVALIDYFNYFCLFNIVSFVHSIKHISSNQKKLKTIFESIASLDASISIASYIQCLPNYCFPELNTDNRIDMDNIYHPLLEDPVSNNFQLQDMSVLITGSNMAGKTTFIKTIGLNIILGQSISICLAKKANLPKLIVKSSIKRSDDINENKGYYFKEIESVLQFMKMSFEQNNYLFLIDEIFRGTNTIERIAASTSVLKKLSGKSIVFVTTHDVELQKLLSESFQMYHFSEQIEDGKHYFDYLIKPGPTSSRNAIKLLELKGYPESVVNEANELAEKFTLKGNTDHELV